ncbi:PREDICTED: ABC transporter B family member 29, chloroplastic-like isoform X2 [Nicotiana attenuata]|uniref:ABC transporter B family member 29, chloroplastic-like isoform X2 n=1 Tax=Nicotiana attenuata TaxID=49451 RepID=UPI000905D155|nr:PREDICTED: ABC transporter B family member 29, chloroplastic-like isoform X2 [Nicotiana attenuata]
MSLIHLKPPYYGHSPPIRHHKLTVPYQSTKPINIIFNFPISTSALSIKSSSPRAAANSGKFTSLAPLKPYLLSEWQPILCGWICSAISVYSLSKIIPKVGKFSSLMNPPLDVLRLREECLVLGALFVVRLIGNYLQQALLWEAALNCVYKMRVYVFRKVLQRDLGFFEGGSGIAAGDVAYRITAEASDVADTVYSLLNTIVPSSLQLSAMAIQMLVISPVLSLLSALVIPLMGFMIGYLGEKLRDVSNKAQLAVASLSSYLNEILPSILFVKANNAESCESKRFQSLAFADLSATMGKKKLKAFIPQLVQAIYFGVLFTFCTGTLVVSKGSFDCSAMVSFVTSLVLLISPIQDAGKAYNELKQGEPAIQRLFNLTSFEPEETVNPNAVDLHCVAGEVKYYNVSFRYGDNGPLVLKNLDLHIKSGEIVALCGPSGGGKTTLVKLLLRLYDPLQGSVLIDGLDIRGIRLESLRRHVGLVSQDTTLFSGTVAENIGYRDRMTGIDMERVKLAARTASADEFIESLPLSYETNVGPRGSIFSGGQKQRIAIARALYQNPSILILDEATSALDSKSELLVRQALQRLMQDRTVLVIAHRLETVLMAERIFLLEDGCLREVPRSALLDGQNGSLGSLSFTI